MVAITTMGALVVVTGSIARALADDDLRDTAETVGAAIGGVLGPLIIVLVVRFLYIRVFAKHAPLWSPWVLLAAGVIAWLGALGAAGEG